MKYSAVVFIGCLLSFAVSAQETSVELDTLEVSGQADQETFSTTLDHQGSQIQLDVEELTRIPGTGDDPLQAILILPGIVSSETSGAFYVRGSDANENLVWADGLPLGYIYHLGGLISVINPEVITGLDTYLGGFPVEYGDALGGVVDVTLRAPKSDRWHQTYQAGLYQASMLAEGPVTDKDSVFVAARRSYIDLFLPSTGSFGGDSENEYTLFPQFYDMQMRWRHELEEGFWDLSFFNASDSLGLVLRDEVEKDPALGGDLQSTQGFTTLGWRWVHPIGDDWTQQIRAGIFTDFTDFQIGTQQADDPNPGDPFYLKLDSSTTFLYPQWQWYQNDSSDWKFGLDLAQGKTEVDAYIIQQPSESDVDTDLTGDEKFSITQLINFRETSAYSQWDKRWGNWSSQFGLRFSHVDSEDGFQYDGWSPRWTLEYALNEKTRLFGHWGRFLQIPQGNYLVEEAGNPDLDWTEAEHRILGVKHQPNRVWSGQVELYHKPMRDLVVEVEDEDPPDNYENGGRGEAYGLDVLLKRQAGKDDYGWISYSYARSRRYNDVEDTERDFSADQPHTLTIAWGAPLWGWLKEWNWGIKFSAHSGKPYTEVIGRDAEALAVEEGETEAECGGSGDTEGCRWVPVYGEHNAERLPFYTRLDLRIDREYQRTGYKMALAFELLNAGGLLEQSVVGYEYEDDYSDFADPTPVYGFPIFPSFSIKAQF